MTVTAERPKARTAEVAEPADVPVRQRVSDVVPGATLVPQIAPHAALGALVLAAGATRAAMHLSDADAAIALSVAGTAVVVAVVAACVAGVRLADRKSRHLAFAFIATAAGWLSTVTVTGLSLDAVAILAALGYGLSLHWWRKRRITGAAPLPGVDRYVTRWAKYLSDGDWKGTRLEGRERVKDGVTRYVLRLVPGRHTYGKVMGSLELIRGVLGLEPGQDFIVERHPVFAAPNLLLTIVTNSPVKTDQTWPGPGAFNPDTGRVALGPFIDGEGLAYWKAYVKNRLFGGYLCGITSTGKSRMIESVALSLAASETHPTVIMFGDGQGGASSPLLRKHADYAATTFEQIFTMLAGLMLVGQLRQDENDLFELEGFTPTEDRPGVLAVVDEFHKALSKAENPLLAEQTQLMMATIAREFGKVGIALILASQQSTLDAFGGAGNLADALRNNLLAGNGILMRCKTNNAKVVFNVDVDPRQFPDMPGYAFIVDPEEGARSAPFRGYYVKDEQRTYWPERIRWRSLDDGAANTFGDAYLRRRELAAEARQQKLESIKARRAGNPWAEPPRGLATTMSMAGDGTQPLPANVVAFPTWDPAVMRIAAPKVTDGHRRLTEALLSGAVLSEGFTRPSVVAEEMGWSVKWAGIMLADLVALGVVRKGDVQGRYYPTGESLEDRAEVAA